MPEYRPSDPELLKLWQQADPWPAAERETIMAITSGRDQQEPGATYTPESDVYETLEDGRTTLKAAKGVALPIAEAERLGLIKPTKSAGPSETKAEKAAAEKAAKEGAAKNEAAEAAQHNQPVGAERAPAAEPAKD